MAVAQDKTPVWYRPRDSEEDRVCYYLRDGRSAQHEPLAPLTPHPLSNTGDDRYKDLVFLYREPVGNEGFQVRDWYGPCELVDDLLSVNTAGGAYQSALLWARGTTPPAEDTRVPLLGEQVGDANSTWDWEWVEDPATSIDGEPYIRLLLDLGQTPTGDEVYANITAVPAALENVLEVGIHKIVRHTNGEIHISLPYDASISEVGQITATLHEACYILDGYADSENAPGVLANLFNVRSFTYRLGTPSTSAPWDDNLGLELPQESRPVPATWARKWEAGYPSAATSDEQNAVSYQAASKLIQIRQKSGVTGPPAEDNRAWPVKVRVRVPTILKAFSFPLTWALAFRGDYRSYDEDYGISQSTWGPGEISCEGTVTRRIVLEADIAATVASEMPGGLFSFQPQTYPLKLGSYMGWAGSNVWTRARVRAVSLGPFLISGSVQADVPVGQFPQEQGTGVNVDSGTVTLTDPAPVPWGTTVNWGYTVTKARWGYWILDFTKIDLPADPS